MTLWEQRDFVIYLGRSEHVSKRESAYAKPSLFIPDTHTATGKDIECDLTGQDEMRRKGTKVPLKKRRSCIPSVFALLRVMTPDVESALAVLTGPGADGATAVSIGPSSQIKPIFFR